ncbi:unnamed protein product [Paramecium sonneborni]|uniref:Transmembrane protein n=1 Tax=Paramecium sonneborni TaxID=65129 RepID=A0A8S1M7K5_9CILI|nr:unnamed protein product [Paramecium sonneborni]
MKVLLIRKVLKLVLLFQQMFQQVFIFYLVFYQFTYADADTDYIKTIDATTCFTFTQGTYNWDGSSCSVCSGSSSTRKYQFSFDYYQWLCSDSLFIYIKLSIHNKLLFNKSKNKETEIIKGDLQIQTQQVDSNYLVTEDLYINLFFYIII